MNYNNGVYSSRVLLVWQTSRPESHLCSYLKMSSLLKHGDVSCKFWTVTSKWCQKKCRGIYYNLKLELPDMWRRVVWYKGTSISEEHAACVFKVEVTISEMNPQRSMWKVTNPRQPVCVVFYDTFRVKIYRAYEKCLVKDKFQGIWKEAVVT
jgi:hypothetical protein